MGSGNSLGNLQIRGLRMPMSDRELMSVVKVCVEAIRILDARMSGIAAVKGEYDADKVEELEKRIDELERKVSALGSSSGGGGGGGGSAEYEGYFKVVKATDTTVSVVDGAAPVSSTCGYYEHGIQRVAVTKPSAITVSATGFIYVTITYSTVYVFTFAFAATLPASENGSIVRKIADVAFADGKITTITQAHHGILITPGVF